MDSLPKLKQQTVKEYMIGGFKLRFRKIKLNDADLFTDIQKYNLTGLASSLYALAYLMTGYEDDLQARLDFLNSIELDNVEDMFMLRTILEDLGLENSQAKDIKKKK